MPSSSPHVGAIYDLAPASTEFRDGMLHAVDFGDGYFGFEDGLAEARHVFLEGNGLADRFAGATHLTIAETGFGTGLNCLAVLSLLNSFPKLHLDYVSVEKFPLILPELEQAHAPFSELEAEATDLRTNLPPRWPGYHLVRLCGGRLTLHLHYGDVASVLPTLDFLADAWFLDGFAPARNPDMWAWPVLEQIGRLTRPGGTLASFTAAGNVRRGLEVAGFDIERVRGFGRKREMIKGVRRGSAENPSPRGHRIAVVGAGIAGASVAVGLRRRGARPLVLETGHNAGSGASGNRMALQSPKLTLDHNATSRMSASCLSLASRISDEAGATVGHGVVAFDMPARLAARHDVFRSQRWPADLVRTAEAADMPHGANALSGVVYDHGRVVMPAVLLQHFLDGVEHLNGFDAISIVMSDGGLEIRARDGRIETVDGVVVALGSDIGPFLGRLGHTMPVELTHGMVSQLPSFGAMSELDIGLSFGGYLTPALDGKHDLGATFWKGQGPEGLSERLTAGHDHNLALLPEPLQQSLPLAADGFGARMSRRASLPDRRPLSGRLSEGLFVFGGLGARGFTLAPLLGDLLAAEILARPVPLPRDQLAGLGPLRYAG